MNSTSTSSSSSSALGTPLIPTSPHPHRPSPSHSSKGYQKDPQVKEIPKPSQFDVPDSLLIRIFTFSNFKFINQHRFRVIANGILTFLALVLYQHPIYDIFWFPLPSSADFTIYSFCLLFGSIFLLVVSRSLESLVQYQPNDPEQNFILSLMSQTNYCFGYVDSDLRTCCSVDCTVHIFGYHFYILRFIRYNINAILITACWCGSDNLFSLLTQEIMQRRNSSRLSLDLFLLIIANCLLLYCGQFSGQMGVFSENRAVETLSFSTKSVIDDPDNGLHGKPTQIKVHSPLSSTTSQNTNQKTIQPLSTSQPAPVSGSGSGPGNGEGKEVDQENRDISFDERFSERESSFIERSTMEASLHFKVTLTLIGVLLFWFCLWDLCWNYPREALINTIYDSRDDDVSPVDSYSRRHVSPRVEIYLMLVGVLYCLASSLVLVLTGGLYALTKYDNSETHAIHRHTMTRFETTLRKWGLNLNAKFETFSIQIGDKLFMPFRLIEYNILGAFGVIAWIGFDTIITSLENLFLYYYILNPIARYTLDVFEIILAIILLTKLSQFGNQFGGRDHLSIKHEIVSVDGIFNLTGSHELLDEQEKGRIGANVGSGY